MSWIILILAGAFEVVWTYYLKLSNGFQNTKFSIYFLISLIMSMGLLSLSLKSIPVGVAYPIWTGIGAVGSVLLGFLIFREPLTTMKLVFTSLILIGIIGLKVFSID